MYTVKRAREIRVNSNGTEWKSSGSMFTVLGEKMINESLSYEVALLAEHRIGLIWLGYRWHWLHTSTKYSYLWNNQPKTLDVQSYNPSNLDDFCLSKEQTEIFKHLIHK